MLSKLPPPQVSSAVVQWTLDHAGLESLQISALKLQLDHLTTYNTTGVGIIISPNVNFGLRQIGGTTSGERVFGKEKAINET